MSTLAIDTIQGATTAASVDLSNATSLKMPAGAVIQTVSQKFDGAGGANQYTTTSSSFVDSTMSVTITPKFNTSKILVRAFTQIYTTSTQHGEIAIYRGASEIVRTSIKWINTNESAGQGMIEILDNPATTSATEYSIYFRSNGSATTYINGSSSSDSGITAQEISQ